MRDRVTDLIIAALCASLALNKWRLWTLQERSYDAGTAIIFAMAAILFTASLFVNRRRS